MSEQKTTEPLCDNMSTTQIAEPAESKCDNMSTSINVEQVCDNMSTTRNTEHAESKCDDYVSRSNQFYDRIRNLLNSGEIVIDSDLCFNPNDVICKFVLENIEETKLSDFAYSLLNNVNPMVCKYACDKLLIQPSSQHRDAHIFNASDEMCDRLLEEFDITALIGNPNQTIVDKIIEYCESTNISDENVISNLLSNPNKRLYEFQLKYLTDDNFVFPCGNIRMDLPYSSDICKKVIEFTTDYDKIAHAQSPYTKWCMRVFGRSTDYDVFSEFLKMFDSKYIVQFCKLYQQIKIIEIRNASDYNVHIQLEHLDKLLKRQPQNQQLQNQQLQNQLLQNQLLQNTRAGIILRAQMRIDVLFHIANIASIPPNDVHPMIVTLSKLLKENNKKKLFTLQDLVTIDDPLELFVTIMCHYYFDICYGVENQNKINVLIKIFNEHYAHKWADYRFDEFKESIQTLSLTTEEIVTEMYEWTKKKNIDCLTEQILQLKWQTEYDCDGLPFNVHEATINSYEADFKRKQEQQNKRYNPNPMYMYDIDLNGVNFRGFNTDVLYYRENRKKFKNSKSKLVSGIGGYLQNNRISIQLLQMLYNDDTFRRNLWLTDFCYEHLEKSDEDIAQIITDMFTNNNCEPLADHRYELIDTLYTELLRIYQNVQKYNEWFDNMSVSEFLKYLSENQNPSVINFLINNHEQISDEDLKLFLKHPFIFPTQTYNFDDDTEPICK